MRSFGRLLLVMVVLYVLWRHKFATALLTTVVAGPYIGWGAMLTVLLPTLCLLALLRVGRALAS